MQEVGVFLIIMYTDFNFQPAVAIPESQGRAVLTEGLAIETLPGRAANL